MGREREFSAEWRTRDDARQALARRLIELEAFQPPPEPPPFKTFAVVAEEYLALKRAKGKRSIHDDELILTRLKAGSATQRRSSTSRRSAPRSTSATGCPRYRRAARRSPHPHSTAS